MPLYTLHSASGTALATARDFCDALDLMRDELQFARVLRASDGAVLAVRTVAEKRAIAAADVSEGRGWKFGDRKRRRVA